MRPRGDPAQPERLRRVALVQAGRKQTEVAQKLEVSDRAVPMWIRAFRQHRPDRLKAKRRPSLG